nr:protein preli-like [Lepeophtheirus salmonis]XP_040577379.1 protein preli-like [Lepeophtheirus salmonis]XP_040577380.1 protein preli-like [Lepeophtheirus salmonis]
MSDMYWKTEHKHNYCWDQVAKGFWKRYPNPNSQHVFSEDIIASNLEGSVLQTKRVIMKTNKLPSWGRHFFSARRVPVIEEAFIDASKKEIITYTRNIGLRTFMGTTEKATYLCDKDGNTRVIKEVWIESDIYGFRRAIKKFGVERFKSNSVKATEGFDFVLRELFTGDKLH